MQDVFDFLTPGIEYEMATRKKMKLGGTPSILTRLIPSQFRKWKAEYMRYCYDLGKNNTSFPKCACQWNEDGEGDEILSPCSAHEEWCQQRQKGD